MRILFNTFFALTILVFVTKTSRAQNFSPSAEEKMCKNVLFTMLDAVKSLQKAQFELVSRERVNGNIEEHTAVVAIEYAPKKVIIQGLDENRELANEILFIEGQNNNLALVSPIGFPYINLNLDPIGNTMRNNRHLTILEAGGQFLGEMIKIGYIEAEKNHSFSSRFSADTALHFKKFEVDKITIYNEDYAYYNYTVKKGETLRSICFKKGIPEQKVIDINENVDGFNDDLAGEEIKLPNYYAKKFEMLIHAQDAYPILVRVYDELGLFEEYEYIYFNSTPNLPPNTFNSDNPKYTF